MSSGAVHIVNISSFYSGSDEDKRKIAKQVAQACEEIGFLVIKGHNIPQNAIDDFNARARDFFDMPLDQKLLSKPEDPHTVRGYGPLAGESLGALAVEKGQRAAPDLKETFEIGPFEAPLDTMTPDIAALYNRNLWEGTPPGMKEAGERYFRAAEALAVDLMKICALALDLDEDYFEPFVGNHGGLSGMRVINYPHMDRGGVGQVRGGAHTDYTTLTICAVDDTPGGLQVRTHDDRWEDVPYEPGALVINLGDLMARWTNDRWVSTMHRVSNPPADGGTDTRRQSIIFFHNTRADSIIECLPNCSGPDNPSKYPPVRSIDYLMNRIATQQKMVA